MRTTVGGGADTDSDILAELQAQIDSLPSVDEVENMPEEEQNAIYENAQNLIDILSSFLDNDNNDIDSLGLDTIKLEDLMAFFATFTSETAITNQTELQNALNVNNATVKLTQNINLTSQLSVTKTVTLDLNGFTIDAQSKCRAIHVNGGNLTLTDTSLAGTGKISNGNAANGGGVYVTGTFNLKGGIIADCTATSTGVAYGGAIYVASGHLNITGGTISDCTAKQSGGGVYNNGTFTMSGTAKISGCDANGTVTPNGGGGVYNAEDGTFKLQGGTIEKCNVKYWGGGVCTLGAFTMSSGTIDNCTTSYWGGGMVIANSDATISGGTISNCKATDSRYGAGGIDIYNGILILKGGKITDCTSEGVAGGILVGTSGTLNMSNATISGCTAVDNGGGVRVWTTSSAFNMTSGTITGCSATGTSSHGGGICNQGTLTKTGGRVYACTAATNPLICDHSGNADVTTYTVTFNTQGGTTVASQTVLKGDTITLPDDPELEGEEVRFTGWYTGAKNSGTKWNFDTDTVTGNLTLYAHWDGFVYNETELNDALTAKWKNIRFGDDIPITKTVSVGYATTIDLRGYDLTGTNSFTLIQITSAGNLTLNDCKGGGVLSKGKANITEVAQHNAGGAIYSQGTFIMNGGTISGCSTDGIGGGIYAEGNVWLNRGKIESCTATLRGGAMCIRYGTTYISDGFTINNCTGTLSTGGIQVTTNATLRMSGGTISNCTGTEAAGAVYLCNNGQFFMTGGTISACKTTSTDKYGGGAVYAQADSGAKFTMSGGTISKCTAKRMGGGVFLDKGCEFTMTGGIITGCEATKNGGGVFNRGTFAMSGTAVISDCEAHGTSEINVADGGGGVFTQATMTMSGGTISNCTAQRGGGIKGGTGTLTVTGGTINACTATKHGAGIFCGNANEGVFKMSGGTITHCTAGSLGGGLVVGNCTATVTGGTIEYCKADMGGGIGYGSVSDGTMTISNMTIDHCTATTRGGGIRVNNVTLTISGTKVTNCVADGYGGGVVVEKAGGLTMTSGTITGNTAGEHGGGICNYGGKLTVKKGSKVSGNTAPQNPQICRSHGGTSTLEESYTVTFNTQGGGTIPDQIMVGSGKVVKPTDPTRDGYVFEGWYYNNTQWNFNTNVTGDMTLTAKWEEVTPEKYPNLYYKVTFDTTRGGNTLDPVYVLKSGAGTISAPTDAKKYRYELLGWNTASGTAWDFKTDKVTSDMTLTAKWKCIVYNESELNVALTDQEPEIYVGQSFTMANTAVVGYKTMLDLQGFTLTMTGSKTVFKVTKAGDFTLEDSSEKGTGAITGGVASEKDIPGSLVGGGIHNLGNFTLKAGTISDCSAMYGGGVYSAGTFNMTGGLITGCTGTCGAGGVAQDYSGNTMTMSGGVITLCHAGADGAGGIAVGHGAKLILNSGIISRCDTTGGSGGGVSIWHGDQSTSTQIEGGVITGCTATNNGGGVYVTKGATLTMTAGSISDCHVSESCGGGVGTDGTFNMSGGTITECTAPDYGGGVAVWGSFSMSKGTIQKCQATKLGGGAVGSSGTFTMSGTAKIDNCSAPEGGAIAEAGVSTLSGGTISDCIATASGGAVLVMSGGLVNLKGTTISGCTATTNGAGVYVGTSATLNMTSGTITGCSATSSNSHGGGICNYGTLKMTGGTVESCTAATNPLICNHGSTNLTNYTVTFNTNGGNTLTSQKVLSGNLVEMPTGATKYRYEFLGWYTTQKCTSGTEWDFEKDKVTKNITLYAKWKCIVYNEEELKTALGDEEPEIYVGTSFGITSRNDVDYETILDLQGFTISGAGNHRLFYVTGHFTLTDSSEQGTGTLKNGYTTAQGGGVCVVGGTFIMKAGTITNCKAMGDGGGGISVSNAGHATISGGTISNCTAPTAGSDGGIGGGIAVFNSSNGGGNLTITGGTITGCSAARHSGGVMVASGCNLTMTGGTIENCTAPYAAGMCVGTASANSNTGTISGSAKIQNCTATLYGGGLYVGPYATVTMSGNVLILDCKANVTGTLYGGGGVYNRGSFTMSGGQIEGCSGYRGGAINNYAGTLKLSGGMILECSATADGGAIVNHTAGSVFTMTGGTIMACEATTGGGVWNGNCTAELKGGTITGCTATNGGGIAMAPANNGNGTLKIAGVSVTGCSATTGGGVYNKNSILTISSGSITNCTSKDNGGGAYSTYQLTVTGGTIAGCQAGTHGGGICNTATVKISGGNVYGCTAPVNPLICTEHSDTDPEITTDKYTVTFDSRGGSAVESQTIIGTGTVMEPTDPTRDDYKFLGWYTKASGGTLWNFDTTISANTTLYAHWEQVTPENSPELYWKVTFDPDNGDEKTYQYVKISTGGKVSEPGKPIKDKCVFQGWYLDDTKWDFDENVTKTMTLIAKWTKETDGTEPEPTASAEPSPAPTTSVSPSPSLTPVPPTATPEPTATVSPTPTVVPTPTPEPSVEPTLPPVPTESPDPDPDEVVIPTPSSTPVRVELPEDEDDLIDKILGEDKGEVVDGEEEIRVWLEVEEISAVEAEEKTAIDSQRGDYDVGMLLDVSMFLKIGSNPAKKLTEIAKPVTVVVPISDELLVDYEHREYKVIRVHNGVAEEISATVDPVAKTLTFTTDRFSTYAVAYKTPAKAGETTGNTGNSGDTKRTGTENPATGDTTDLEKYLYMMLLSGAALVSLLAMKRRKQNW